MTNIKVTPYKGTTYNPKIKFDNKVKPYQEKKYETVHQYDKVRPYEVKEYKGTIKDIPKYQEYVPPWSRDKDPYERQPPQSKPAPASTKAPKETKPPYSSSIGSIKRSFYIYGLDF